MNVQPVWGGRLNVQYEAMIIDTPKTNRLSRLPEELQRRMSSQVADELLLACSAYDLDSRGQYSTGYLVLADGRLGHFVQANGAWQEQWLGVGDLEEARVVEGLGMSVLRLVRSGRVVAEYRFTNRHAKSMAELQQQLQRRIKGEEEPPSRGEKAEGQTEKKIHCEKCGGAIPDWAETCPACLHQRKVLMRLLEFVRPYRWRAIIGFVLALVGLGLELIRPKMIQWLVDGGIDRRNTVVLFWVIGGFVVVMLVEAVTQAWRGKLMAGLGMRVAAEIRDRCYSHLHKLSLSYFSRKTSGSLITRLTSDSDRIWDFIAFNLVEVIISLLTFVGVGVMLFVTNWRLASLVLIPLPFMLVLMMIFHKRMHGQFMRIWHRWSAMTSVVADAIPGVRVIKAFNQEKREVDRFHHRNYQVYDEEQRLVNVFTFFGPTMALATQVGFLIIWGVGGYWAIRDYQIVAAMKDSGQAIPANVMTIGKLMAFQGFMWMFFRPIHQVAHMSRMFNRAATSVQRIFEVLDTQPEVFTRRDARPIKHMLGKIEFRNVSFSYDGVRRVLKNVSFQIEAGEMVGLVGHSGSGKTTLINLLCRFYDPLEGQIILDGQDLRDYNLEDLRRFTGVVLQEPYLFRGTIAENVAYGNPGSGMADIIAAARAANVHDAIVGFPDGYDTVVGERGQTLSGGERQRVSIARAILNNPRLLILDEATSNVDTQTEQQIQEALDRLVADRTTIAIAHRLSTLQRADRLIVLKDGQIVEQGTHSELTGKEDGIYAGLLKMQTNNKSIIALNT